MNILQDIKARLRGQGLRVVMPEAEDPRIHEAGEALRRQGLAEPVPLCAPDDASDLATHLQSMRPGLSAKLAARMLDKPLIRAAAMVALGQADALVAGVSHPTRKVIEAAGLAIGMDAGVQTPSSFFLMLMPDGRALIFADCAVNVAPDARELADIATASAATARAVLGRADVAMLSFSTDRSGSGPAVDLVRDAAQLAGVPGPLQADAALNGTIAAQKGVTGGQANTLIFPTLDAGNIAYKLMQELAGAQALGPILQGFAKPVCDLSRGATVDDIVNATAVTLALR